MKSKILLASIYLVLRWQSFFFLSEKVLQQVIILLCMYSSGLIQNMLGIVGDGEVMKGNSSGIDLSIASICRTKYGNILSIIHLDNFDNVVTPIGLNGGYEIIKTTIEAIEQKNIK